MSFVSSHLRSELIVLNEKIENRLMMRKGKKETREQHMPPTAPLPLGGGKMENRERMLGFLSLN